MRRNTIRIFLALVCIMTLVSCGPDISLDFDDPEQTPNHRRVVNPDEIRVRISLRKGVIPILSSPIEVDLGGYFIEGGGISVNGASMEDKCDAFFDFICRYTTSRVAVVPNKLYKFIVTLSDKSTYETTVSVQEKDLNVLNVPDSHNPQDDLVISWKEINPQYPLTLRMNAEHFFGSPFTSFVLPDSCVSNGSCKIPSDFFFSDQFDANGIDRVALSLFSVKSGTLDSFGPDSKFTSVFGIQNQKLMELVNNR